jgi:glutathione S-transferase
MKLHTFPKAPNPRRVHLYLAEKGLQLELVEVNLVAGETRTPEFRAKNAMGAVPVLELDDGSFVSESGAIVEYLEELHPEPSMLGTTPEERLRARELDRIAEQGVLLRVGQVLQNSHAFFARQYKQSADAAEMGQRALDRALDVLEGRLGEAPFLLGERPMIPDCTLFSALSFAYGMGFKLELAARPKLARFNEAFRSRPSARA